LSGTNHNLIGYSQLETSSLTLVYKVTYTVWCTGTHHFLTSMLVERMEVLKFRQKFEVELSTFPDSTNTGTSRKLVFSLTRVCLCEKVCQWISYEYVDRFE